MSDDYDVGYGKPPKKNQFQKGKSGNPKGRPKGAKSFGSAVRKQLSEKVQLIQNGKPRKVSKADAVIMRVMKDALEGKPRAQTEILRMAQTYLPDDTQSDALEQPVAAEDQAIIDAFVKRMLAQQTEGGENGGSS